MSNKKKRLPKWVTGTLIPLAIAVAISIALLITNAFIPVKYLTAYFVKAKQRTPGELRVTYIDVGFGDSTLIELPDGKVMLIDGGNGDYNRELPLIKYLNSRGVDTIDYLICTSVKREHCGGLAEIVKYKNVKKAYIPYCVSPTITNEFNAFWKALTSYGVDIEYSAIGKGYTDNENDLFFTFLSPSDKDSPASEYTNMNATASRENIEKASAVVWLQYGTTAFAFTSDARQDTLKNITEKYELSKALDQPFCKIDDYSVKLEDCKVVTVAAHGGENNTYAPWYECIKPQCAVISVGENFSQYPSFASLTDICAYVQPLTTQDNGNIVITATAESFTVL